MSGLPSERQIDRLPFDQAMARARTVVQTTLDDVICPDGTDLIDAMRYAIVGGKALRAFLVIEGARLHGVAIGPASMAALAIECIHAYSLIHDDLPCMDDDDLRRGQPTVHKKWNEHTAVLAGDALQAVAFEVLSRDTLGPAATALRLTQKMALAAGHHGMVGGQMLDIMAESQAGGHSLADIEAIQNGKTGALIRWSAMAGADLADADTNALYQYGDKLGLAFQIADDILDVEGDAAAVGKAVGKDEAAGKATFVSLLGLAGAKRRAQDLADGACDALSIYGEDADTLKDAARFVVNRTH